MLECSVTHRTGMLCAMSVWGGRPSGATCPALFPGRVALFMARFYDLLHRHETRVEFNAVSQAAVCSA